MSVKATWHWSTHINSRCVHFHLNSKKISFLCVTVTSYGNGWRKDVVNQCLEFGAQWEYLPVHLSFQAYLTEFLRTLSTDSCYSLFSAHHNPAEIQVLRTISINVWPGVFIPVPRTPFPSVLKQYFSGFFLLQFVWCLNAQESPYVWSFPFLRSLPSKQFQCWSDCSGCFKSWAVVDSCL